MGDIQTAEELKEIRLTPQQEKQWEDTMSMMVWTAPGFQHIWYKLLSETHNNGGSKYNAVLNRECDIAATDGKNVLINPDRFFNLSLPERVYVAAHEIVHNVYDDVNLLRRCTVSGKVPMHDGTDRPFNNDKMQKAMDARINALLTESRIGKAPTKCGDEDIGHYDPEVTSSDSVLDVYKKYYDDDPNPEEEGDQPGGSGNDAGNNPGGNDAGNNPGGNDAGNNPGGFDKVLPPGSSTGQDPQQAASQRNPGQWAVELAAAQTIEGMRSQGKMAGALKRMFESILEPEINWVDHIQTLINRTCGDGGYDWTHPDEWFSVLDIYSPKPTGTGAGHIVVGGDTSGSRTRQELESNIAELAGMLADVTPQRLTVIWWDAAISHIDEVTDPMDLEHIRSRGVGGGGGTDITPMMKWIAAQEEDPDLCITFTDGCLTFPKEPRYPFIWASSTDRDYPWGSVVRVNKKGAP